MQIRVETQPSLHGNGSGNQRPAKNGENVPDQQADQNVNGRCSQRDEGGSDNEFRRSYVLTRIQPGKMRPPMQLVIRNRQLLRVCADDDRFDVLSTHAYPVHVVAS